MKLRRPKLHKAIFSVLLIASLLLSMTVPALAATSDTLVQCSSSGTVTNHTAITSVSLPVTFAASSDYYSTVDVAVYTGGSAVYQLTNLVPGTDGKVTISLGAVTKYAADTVYEIQYRGHYYVYGEDTQLIDSWQSSGLYFKVEAGSVTGAALSSGAETFDKYAPTDVQTTITWNDAANVTGITANSTSIGTANYSVTAVNSTTATLTIKKGYLATQSNGTLTLTVAFDQGNSETLEIDVVDSTPPSISPTSATFDLNSSADVSTAVTWNSASSVTGVKYGATSLTSGSAYTVNSSVLLLKVSYLSGLNLSAGNTAKFDVTFDTGAVVTLTVDIANSYTKSTVATLDSLKVGGSAVSGFNPAVITYNVELPYGTQPGSAAATVGATASDSKATAVITQATALPGSTSITVTAEDKTTTKTYTVNFTLGAAPTVPVSNITVTGSCGAGSVAVGNTLQMSAAVSPDDATDKTVTWSVTNGTGGATIGTTGLLSATGAGTVTVKATAADGSGVYGEKEITVTSGSVNTHTVSVSNDGNGTGSADLSSAAKGTTVTLSSTPNSGYHFKEWQVITPSALSITSNTFAMPDEAVIVKAVFEADAATDCTVTFKNGSMTYAAKTVASGGSIGSTSWPTDPTKSGYTFNGWYTGENGSGSKFTSGTAVTSNMTVYAYWSANSSESGSSSGSAETGTTIKMTTADGVTTASAEVTGSTGSDGTGKASVTQKQMQDAVDAAVKEAAAKGTKPVVEISVAAGADASGISVTIPRNSVQAVASSGIDAVKISSTIVSVAFDGNALDAISASAAGDLTLKAAPAESAALSDSDKAIIGSRPVYSLTLSSGGTAISSFGGGKATVSIPYTLASGEDANKIVVYYISGSGELVSVPNCKYDAATGTITFTTTHFSNYAVGYNNVSFTDVSGWYTDYVSYLAARGIIGGTGDGKFSPDANITRAQFVTILARMSGENLSGYASSEFSDVSTTDWYFKAVQWAFKNGITTGSDGKFNPNATITRQDIAVMLVRYADKVASYTLPKTNSAVTFTDSAKISAYASDAVTAMQQAGIISGNSDGSFAPTANATRAQAAKMITLLIRASVN